MIGTGIVCAVLAWLGFANPLWHLPLAGLALPFGVAAIAQFAPSPRSALKAGWISGLVFFTLSLYWVALPVHNFGGLPWVLAVPCPLLLAAYLALFPGLVAGLLAWARPRLPALGWVLLAGGLWFCAAWIRGRFLTGFPWQTLPQGLAAWPMAVQPVAWLGSYGYAGLLAAIAAAAALPKPRFVPQCAAATALLGLAAFGIWSLNQPLRPEATADISLVQGNIDQDHKWSPDYQNATLRTYLQASRRQVETNAPQLIIWPETAVPFYLQEATSLSTRVHRFVREQDTALLTGSPGYTGDKQGGYDLHNRAYLLRPEKDSQVYDKVHLVPFGEYVPLGTLFPFIEKLAHGAGDFRPGSRTAPLTQDDLAIGPLICYETIFPELSTRRVRDGANLLVNISNDGWFGRSPAPRQHLHQATLRCVEQGRSMVRSTNSGISAFINPRGRILETSPLFQRLTMHTTELPLMRQRTPYSRFTAAVEAGIAGLTLLLLVGGAVSPRRVRHRRWTLH
ncbi:MAG: apolipoprotein N-acyltransferase [Desulfohalobium sp.]